MRRLVGLVLGVFMLHLNAARLDVACAQHKHASHSAHHGSKSTPCETPVSTDCCQALVTCSVGLGCDDVRVSMDLERIHSGVSVAVDRAPLSRVTTPDPPPPKA